MSLSLASASSQHLRNNSVPTMPIVTPRSFICAFRTTTAAQQVLMWSQQEAMGTITFTQKLQLIVSGATVRAQVEITKDTAPPVLASATVGAGIVIAANGWNWAGCSITATDLNVWMLLHDGNFTTGSTAHTVPLGSQHFRHSIGSAYDGANYMNGQIGHAMAYDGAISQSDFEHVAFGRAQPRAVGDNGANLTYWLPLVTAEYHSWFGSLTGARLGQTIVLNAQNGPTLSPENPGVFPATGLLQMG